MSRILVTGATGFIGNYVVSQLLQAGHEVIASSTNEKKAGTYEWFDKVTFVPFDLGLYNEGENYYEYFHNPDQSIHLAWEGLPNYKSLFHFEENLPRHYHFLKNLVAHGLPDLTVTGTCFEYGMQEGELVETMATVPDNPYGIAKDTLRKFLEQLQTIHPFILKWVRLFYMYGRGQNPNSLLSQLDRSLNNGERTFNMSGGEQTRDYLPVEKVAANIIRTALQTKITGIINNSSDDPVKVIDFVKNYLESRQSKIELNTGYYPYPTYEPMHFWGNADKLKSIE